MCLWTNCKTITSIWNSKICYTELYFLKISFESLKNFSKVIFIFMYFNELVNSKQQLYDSPGFLYPSLYKKHRNPVH